MAGIFGPGKQISPFSSEAAKAPRSSPWRPVLVAAVIGLLAGGGAVAYRATQATARLRQQTALEARAAAALIEQHLDRALGGAPALGALVRLGNGQLPAFAQIATELLGACPGVVRLELQPNGVTTEVAPRAGNERCLGVNALNDPASRAAALTAMNTRRMVLDTPVTTGRGEVLAIARLPVHLRDRSGREVWWGFIAATVRLDEVVRSARLGDLRARGYEYYLYSDPGTRQPAVGIAASATAISRRAVIQPIRLHEAALRLAVHPRSRTLSWEDILLAGLVLIVPAAGLAALVWLVQQRRQAAADLAEGQARSVRENSRFRSLLESASDALIVADRSGMIEMVNTRAEKLFGWHREEMLGRPVEMLLPERFGPAHPGKRESFHRAPAGRTMGDGLPLAGLRKDHTEFPVEISLVPMENPETRQPLVCASVRDLTERTLAAQTQADLRREQEERQREREELREALRMGEHTLAQLGEASQALIALRESQEQLETNLAARQAELTQAAETVAGLQQAKAKLEETLAAREQARAKAEQDAAQTRDEQARLAQALEAQAAEVKQAGQVADKARAAQARLDKTLEARSAELEEATRTAQEAAQKCARLEEELAAQSAALEKALRSNARLKAQVSRLEESPNGQAAAPPPTPAPEAPAAEPEAVHADQPAPQETTAADTSSPPDQSVPEAQPGPAAAARPARPRKPRQDDQIHLFAEEADADPGKEKEAQAHKAEARPKSLPAGDDLPSVEGLDSAAILERAGGRRQYLKMLRQFADQQGNAAEQVRDLLTQGQSQAAERLAGTLKEAAETVGATEVRTAAAELEQGIAARLDPAELEAVWGGLDRAMGALMAELKPLLKPAREKPAEEEPPPLNAPEFRKALHQMQPLLAENDPGAADCLAANRDTFRAAFSEGAFAEFEQQVKAGAFGEALDLLKKAARRHGVG